MLTLLFLGFLIGLSHAAEPDHLAALSSLVSGKKDRRDILRFGATWGVGHALILLLVGGAVVVLQTTIAPQIALGLEALVGLMLTGLGVHVLYRLRRDRVHFHAHRHEGGQPHMHLHSHKADTSKHNPAAHKHAHPDSIAWRALIVGMMHGFAGSAALVILTASNFSTPLQGLIYVALFGAGSILGMITVSAAFALPLAYSAKTLTKFNAALQVTIGGLTTVLGLYIAAKSINALIA